MKPEKTADSKKPFRSLSVFVLFAVVAVGGAVLVYSLSQWSAPARAKKLKNPVPATPQAIVAGRDTYGKRCVSCHGERGDGRGEKAESLRVAPSDFTDAHKMSEFTDGELFWRISEGHLPMPPFKKKLSEAERWELVDYIRTFSTNLVAAPPDTSSPAPLAEAPAQKK